MLYIVLRRLLSIELCGETNYAYIPASQTARDIIRRYPGWRMVYAISK
jgi:hypothetical protein